MTEENKKLTKEEKIQKAKNLLNEVTSLELNDEEMHNLVGGLTIDAKAGFKHWIPGDEYRRMVEQRIRDMKSYKR